MPVGAAYERAASASAPSRAAVAGYLGAVERSRAGDHAAAVALLERTEAYADGSPTEQAAIVLLARELAAQGRRDDSCVAARRYLVAFPNGSFAPEMEQTGRGP